MLSKWDCYCSCYLPHTYTRTRQLFLFRSSVRLAASWSWPVNYHLNAVDVKKFDAYAISVASFWIIWIKGWMNSILMYRASSNSKLNENMQRAKKFDAFCELIICMMNVLHLVQFLDEKHWLKNGHIWLLLVEFFAIKGSCEHVNIYTKT